MSEQNQSPVTGNRASGSKRNDALSAKTEIYLLKKKSLTLKVSLAGRKSITVEVFACKDANLELAKIIAQIQTQLIQAEAICYQGDNLYAHLLTVWDKQSWQIQTFEDQ